MSIVARVIPLLALAVCASAQECSTEKVNGDCTLTIHRLYPVTTPTIQMRPGKTITVEVAQPLQFETLTLDPQSAQAVAGTDQTAGLLNAMIPYSKGFVAQTRLPYVSVAGPSPPPPNRAPTPEEVVQADLNRLDEKLNQADAFVKQTIASTLAVYLQLQEILSPLPRPLVAKPNDDTFPAPPGFHPRETVSKAKQKPPVYTLLRPNGLPENTPDPWKTFGPWRAFVLCELNGKCSGGANPPMTNLLNTLAHPDLPALSNGNVTWAAFDAAGAKSDIEKLPQSEQAGYVAQLDQRTAREFNLTAYTTLFSKTQQDLNSYALNIEIVGTPNLADPQNIGVIYDPNCAPNAPHCPKSLILGTQVVYAVDAVNQIGVLPTSVASQKKSIATITVLYADPIFEVSTGVFFSTLPNRSFANVTQVVQGNPPTQGNVVIGQTIVRPTIVPYAAANWRLGHNFAWPDQRRGAVYFTTAIGLNPNNTTAEFAFGPSVSWRALMFSALFHLGHDVELTQGETVGEVWCNQTAKTCSPTPPNPTTQKYWTGAFAFGIGIRVPTSFGSSGGK